MTAGRFAGRVVQPTGAAAGTARGPRAGDALLVPGDKDVESLTRVAGTPGEPSSRR